MSLLVFEVGEILIGNQACSVLAPVPWMQAIRPLKYPQ